IAIIAGYSIAFLFWLYSIPPVTQCNLVPVYCGAWLGLFRSILAGTFVIFLPVVFGFQSRPVPRRNHLILFLIIGSAFLPAVAFPVHAQPVPTFFEASDYAPYTYWTQKPDNVTYNVFIGSEWYVYEF